MLLAARWRQRPPLLVVTVDHGLRPEAAEEARLAAANAARLGLPCRIVQAPRREAGGNLQDWARRARYRCLAEAAREAGCDSVVTAHHRDDQAETFLLRLARGSGVYGLSGMAEENLVAGLRLARPLLGVARSSLVDLVAASGLATADDPGNRDPRYDRARLRALMPALAEHGLGAERLAETAARLRRAANALDHYAGALLAAHFRANSYGVVEGPAASLGAVPEEVGLRALALILKAVGGAEYTPRLESVESLRAAILAAGGEGRLSRTLHGAAIELENGRLAARREWGREGIAATAAEAGTTLVWDRRFALSVPDRPGRLSVGPLGLSERRLGSNAADRATIRCLPGLFADAALVAIPDGIAADAGDPLARLDARCIVGERLRPAAEFTLTAG